MELKQIIETIVSSEPEHWHTFSCSGPYCEPSAYERFTYPLIATYLPDAAITLGLCLDCMDDFKEPWAMKFPDRHASSQYVDVFYHGALVFREVCVNVDGARCLLPLPHLRDKNHDENFLPSVPVARMKFVRLIDGLMGYISDFDTYFARTRIPAVDEVWPAF